MLKKFIALVFVIGLACLISITLVTATISPKPQNSESLYSDCESNTDSEINNIVKEEMSDVLDTSNVDISTQDDLVSEDICIEASEDACLPEESTDNSTDDSYDELTPEEVSDIVDNLSIRLYNDYAEGFNLVDGETYIQDIAELLKKYAPEGFRISAGCAMAYTEGGSGKKGIYANTNNCFGIRAYSSWSGYVYARSTGLVYKDYSTAVSYGAYDFFRAYETIEESVKDYIMLMTSPRYEAVLRMDNDADYFNYVLDKGYGELHMVNTWLYLVDLYDLTQYNIVMNEE